MNWKFWKREPVDPVSRECKHDWTNWTDPVETSVKTYAGMFSENGQRDVWLQSRRCLRCNMAERRFG